MIILLYGKDSYRKKEKQREIQAEYQKKYEQTFSLEKIDVEKTDFKDFLDILHQQSMFVKKKLLVLEGVFLNEAFKKAFSKNYKKISGSEHIILLIVGEVKKSDSLFKKIDKKQDFAPLDGQYLRSWVKKEFQKYNVKIEQIILERLITILGNDLWAFSNEIKKLASFTKEVKREDLNLFLKTNIQAEIFKTIDALASKDKQTALRLVQNHLNKGESPFYLLSMITYQFRNLLLVKACQDKSILKLHPFVLRKLTILSFKYSLEELKNIYQQIFVVDHDMKRGKVLPEQGLRSLVAFI